MLPSCSACVAAALLVAAAAADTRDALLVSPAWLGQHLNDANLVMLHVGDPAQYEAQHVPGARLVRLSDVSVSDRTGAGLMLEMPAADDLRQRLERLGISDDSRVIVYYAQGWVSPATRVMFTLDYAGLGARAALLDGGLDGWTRAGLKTTSTVPDARSGKLSPLRVRSIVIDADGVTARLKTPGFVVIDGRTPSFYDGLQTGGSADRPHKTGHIAGARNVPFTDVTNDDQQWRTPEQLKALFDEAGVKPGDTIIGYCHIGQQATAMLFAARTLGHPVLLYDGSFQDWSRRDLPVEQSPSGAK